MDNDIIFIERKLETKVIMGCRTIAAHKLRTRLGFKQYHVILTKEQSVLTNLVCQVIGLMHIFMILNFQQKLMKMETATEKLTMKYKDKNQ